MPFVHARVVRGVMTDAERTRLVERLTDAVVEVFAQGREEFRPSVWVVVDEVEADHWGVGGVPVELETARRNTGRT